MPQVTTEPSLLIAANATLFLTSPPVRPRLLTGMGTLITLPTLLKSSLTIVLATAVLVPMKYPVPAARVRETVSSASISVSAIGSITTVAVADPAANVIALVAGSSAMPV